MKNYRLSLNQQKFSHQRNREQEAKAQRTANLNMTMDHSGRVFLNRAFEAKNESQRIDENLKEME